MSCAACEKKQLPAAKRVLFFLLQDTAVFGGCYASDPRSIHQIVKPGSPVFEIANAIQALARAPRVRNQPFTAPAVNPETM